MAVADVGQQVGCGLVVAVAPDSGIKARGQGGGQGGRGQPTTGDSSAGIETDTRVAGHAGGRCVPVAVADRADPGKIIGIAPDQPTDLAGAADAAGGIGVVDLTAPVPPGQSADQVGAADAAGGIGIVDRASGHVVPDQSADFTVAADAAGGIGIAERTFALAEHPPNVSVGTADVAGGIGVADRAIVVIADQAAYRSFTADVAGGVDIADGGRPDVPNQPADLRGTCDAAGGVGVADRAPDAAPDQPANFLATRDAAALQTNVAYRCTGCVAEQADIAGATTDGQVVDGVAQAVEGTAKDDAVSQGEVVSSDGCEAGAAVPGARARCVDIGAQHVAARQTACGRHALQGHGGRRGGGIALHPQAGDNGVSDGTAVIAQFGAEMVSCRQVDRGVDAVGCRVARGGCALAIHQGQTGGTRAEHLAVDLDVAPGVERQGVRAPAHRVVDEDVAVAAAASAAGSP